MKIALVERILIGTLIGGIMGLLMMLLVGSYWAVIIFMALGAIRSIPLGEQK